MSIAGNKHAPCLLVFAACAFIRSVEASVWNLRPGSSIIAGADLSLLGDSEAESGLESAAKDDLRPAAASNRSERETSAPIAETAGSSDPANVSVANLGNRTFADAVEKAVASGGRKTAKRNRIKKHSSSEQPDKPRAKLNATGSSARATQDQSTSHSGEGPDSSGDNSGQPETLQAKLTAANSTAEQSDAINKQPADESSSAADDCRYIFGLPKFTWALLCDVLALALVLLCIPLLLTCSRRRPPGAPLFDCTWVSLGEDSNWSQVKI